MQLTALLFALALTPALEETKGYHLVKTVPIPGDGGWDYVVVDEPGRRVYITHGTDVVALDADTNEVKGTISGLKGVHGVAVASELGRGFISDGRANTVVMFDTKTLKKIGDVEVGRNPDAIIYDPATSRVFAFNGAGKSASVLEAKDGKVAGTIELGGKPEYAIADGQGFVFVNMEDTNEVLKLDAKKLKVAERIAIAPAKIPVGMTMDTKGRRLFVGCRSKHLIVIDADTSKVVATEPIGTGVDANCFDPETKLVFSSQGDGTLLVFHHRAIASNPP